MWTLWWLDKVVRRSRGRSKDVVYNVYHLIILLISLATWAPLGMRRWAHTSGWMHLTPHAWWVRSQDGDRAGVKGWSLWRSLVLNYSYWVSALSAAINCRKVMSLAISLPTTGFIVVTVTGCSSSKGKLRLALPCRALPCPASPPCVLPCT